MKTLSVMGTALCAMLFSASVMAQTTAASASMSPSAATPPRVQVHDCAKIPPDRKSACEKQNAAVVACADSTGSADRKCVMDRLKSPPPPPPYDALWDCAKLGPERQADCADRNKAAETCKGKPKDEFNLCVKAHRSPPPYRAPPLLDCSKAIESRKKDCETSNWLINSCKHNQMESDFNLCVKLKKQGQ